MPARRPDDPSPAAGMLRELARPWKLTGLATGVILLTIGAGYYHAPDWDIPISLIMAGCTYLSAPTSLRIVVERRWRQWPQMLLQTWFSVDGCYWLYWQWRDPAALDMRAANFPASLSLYAICGLLWYYRGTLREFIRDARQLRLRP